MTLSPEARAAATVAAGTAAAVRIRGLRKAFGGMPVLRDIDLEVGSGEIVAIIGRSGGGKTTLMRCVNLLERPDAGTIEIGDEKIFADGAVVCRDLAELRHRVGMVFQRFNLFPHLTAVENVMLAPVRGGTPEADAIQRAVSLLAGVGLAHRGLAYPEQMSGGEQQRVAIARALALDPAVLLFDEPTSSLDPEATTEVLKVMRGLAGGGMTMLLVTHEIGFARDVADRVVFVDEGLIVEQGAPAEILVRPREKRTREFLASFGGPNS